MTLLVRGRQVILQEGISPRAMRVYFHSQSPGADGTTGRLNGTNGLNIGTMAAGGFAFTQPDADTARATWPGDIPLGLLTAALANATHYSVADADSGVMWYEQLESALALPDGNTIAVVGGTISFDLNYAAMSGDMLWTSAGLALILENGIAGQAYDVHVHSGAAGADGDANRITGGGLGTPNIPQNGWAFSTVGAARHAQTMTGVDFGTLTAGLGDATGYTLHAGTTFCASATFQAAVTLADGAPFSIEAGTIATRLS